jgi:hypothetical protein
MYVSWNDFGQSQQIRSTFSDDGGAHWSPPVPLTERPFKAGWDKPVVMMAQSSLLRSTRIYSKTSVTRSASLAASV